MIKFVVIFTFALRFVVGSAWLLHAHGYANNGVRGYLMIAGAANEGKGFCLHSGMPTTALDASTERKSTELFL